ncbi:MAG: GNAT family N-acetyltransferase [Thermomicrobiales bacterium]|jgi:GNAT superfamily N-acetyltransferase
MPRTTPATDVSIIPLTQTHASVCDEIGRALPAWFGIEEGLLDLRHAAETQFGFVATVADEVIGFVTLERHFPESSEITWMAVHPDHHRRGVGGC